MAKVNIYVGPVDGGSQRPLIVEGAAVDAIVPGKLVVQTSSGLATSAKTDADFSQTALVALEIGNHRGASVTTAYTVGDTARAVALRDGELAHVRVAAGNNITAKGTALTADGAGSLKIAAAVDGTKKILFVADEVVNVTTAQLVRVRKA